MEFNLYIGLRITQKYTWYSVVLAEQGTNRKYKIDGIKTQVVEQNNYCLVQKMELM